MTEKELEIIQEARNGFKKLVDSIDKSNPKLRTLQEKIKIQFNEKDYDIENPVVYNKDLDKISIKNNIKIIMVADNPGKNEQLKKNSAYLVGQSGKLAESWFKKNLKTDFRSEVLILNKTPIHTPKTAQLKSLLKLDLNRDLEKHLANSQKEMAKIAWGLFSQLYLVRAAKNKPILWLCGIGDLKSSGIFKFYYEYLFNKLAESKDKIISRVWLFCHFSMNRFSIEISQKKLKNESMEEALFRIGNENRKRIFGI